MKRTITITIADLDAAIAQPWNTRTCVFAQAVARETKEEVLLCHNSGAVTKTLDIETKGEVLVVYVFDNEYGNLGQRRRELVEALLPYEVECEVKPRKDN